MSGAGRRWWRLKNDDWNYVNYSIQVYFIHCSATKTTSVAALQQPVVTAPKHPYCLYPGLLAKCPVCGPMSGSHRRRRFVAPVSAVWISLTTTQDCCQRNVWKSRASILQDYWGDIKEEWRCVLMYWWDSATCDTQNFAYLLLNWLVDLATFRKSPSDVQGRSPGRRSGGRSPPPPEAEAFLWNYT